MTRIRTQAISTPVTERAVLPASCSSARNSDMQTQHASTAQADPTTSAQPATISEPSTSQPSTSISTPSAISCSRRRSLGVLLSAAASALRPGTLRAEDAPASQPAEPAPPPAEGPPPPPPQQGGGLFGGRLPALADRPGAAGKKLLEDPVEFTYAFTSEVPCNLRVKQYYELIVKNRPKCWQRIAALIQASNFTGIDEGMKVDAMADLRQAALYLPWALLQRDDYTASVEARKGYLSLNAHIQDLQNAALMAADGQSNAERVQQAFILMSASLDDFLARVPQKYKQGPQGPQDA